MKRLGRTSLRVHPYGVCGGGHWLPPNVNRGCGEPILDPEDLYRCVDCDVPFHRRCLLKHCRNEMQLLRDELAAAKAEHEKAIEAERNTHAEEQKAARDGLNACLDLVARIRRRDVDCATRVALAYREAEAVRPRRRRIKRKS